MTNREAGINVVREMMGDQAAAKLSASAGSNTFGAPIAAYAVDQVFADIWTRPGLDRRSRSLVSMSVMIAMRQPHEFAIHMGAGLNNGLTLKEIEEVLIQALPYVGYPAIATALAGCCCRGYQGARSGRRRKLRWPPRPALTLNGIILSRNSTSAASGTSLARSLKKPYRIGGNTTTFYMIASEILWGPGFCWICDAETVLVTS